MVGPERAAVDKLRAVEVFVPDVEAAEDLNLRPLATAPAALGTRTLLHAPYQPPNLTFGELIVPTIGYRQSEPSEPVRAAKVVQEVGQFGPKVLENRMLRDVGQVFISRIRGANRYAQGGKAIQFAMIITTMQRMSHLVRRLSPPPDIALGVSAKLPLVFRLLDPSKRREATSTDPSLRRHVGPANIKAQ